MPNLTDNPGFTGSANQSNATNGRTSMEDILKSQTEYLKSIDETLKNLLKNGSSFSQSAARDSIPRQGESTESSYKNTRDRSSFSKSSNGSPWSKFTSGVEDELLKAFTGSGFTDELKRSMKNIATNMGVELQDLPQEFGKIVGQSLRGKLSSFGANGKGISGWFRKGASNAKNYVDNIPSYFNQGYQRGVDRWNQQNPEKAARLAPLQAQFAARKEQDEYRASQTSFRTSQINQQFAQSVRAESAQPVTIVGAEVSIPVYMQSESSSFETAETVYKGISEKNEALNNVGSTVESDVKKHFGPENIVKESQGSLSSKIMSAGGGQQAAAGAAGGLGNVASMGMKALTSFGPQMLAMVGIDLVMSGLSKAIAPAIEGLSKLAETASKVANRTHESEKKMLENAKERLTSDVEALVKEPFEILKDAAEKLYEVWDSNIQKINQTQGYNKEDLQSLIGSYAQRLRDEGLSSVVSSADISENLTKVLESGLSGQVAEEFAYLATKLNAAIPTQDFFQYADAYASLAATAIQQGQSEAQAIEYANTQLESFANNILYASRQISGGFSTGLKNANELFEQSVKIAQTGRATNVTEISGVLASVSAIVGAVAPDLATSLTDLIYSAATGGNTSQLIALRSLAGINASNTEFLKEFTQNPKAVFTELFENLAEMQQMSSDNYMEVAEGLAEVFGVSMDALARVDFNYLAQAISEMNVNSSSLDENIKLLASGESTTTAEQLRMQQINEYMINEGLAYVLDNEVARSIQENMWAEQRKNELMEATYGVELQGAAAEAIQGIKQTVENIIGFLIPFIGIGKAIANLISSNNEANALQMDIQQTLEAGKVGSGNKSDLYNLMTRGQDLNLTQDYVTLLGGTSAYGIARSQTKAQQNAWSLFGGDLLSQYAQASLKESDAARAHTGPTSMYAWGVIGKSTASSALGGLSGGSPTGNLVSTIQSATQSAQAQAQNKLEKYLSTEYMQQFVDENKSFDDYFKAADRAMGGKLEEQMNEQGYNKSELESQFQSLQTQKGAQEEAERKQREEDFWKNTQDYLLETIELFNYQNEILEEFYKKHSDFYDAWVDYFVKHTAYSAAYDHTDVTRVQLAERSGSEDAVYALAEALTKNTVDLLDPTIQTNALLSQILIVVNAIMQQNNQTGAGLSLPDTLSGLALGIVKQT